MQKTKEMMKPILITHPDASKRLAKCSGFNSMESFITYHCENYSAIKYAHTFTLVDMEGEDK